MPYRRAAALMLGVRLAIVPIFAQEQNVPGPETPAGFQTSIVVTPERGDAIQAEVPASTVIVDQATLQTRPAVSLAEALPIIPGFQVTRESFPSGLPIVSARGFFGGGEADYVLLLIDGVPALDAESGLADWSDVALSSIRRIEANRGPGASMYGDSAVGGVIQILTNQADPGGQLTTTAGSFDTLTFDGADRRQLAHAGVEASGLFRRTGGVSDHSAASYAAGSARIDGRFGQSLWNVRGSANRRMIEDAGALRLDVAEHDPTASDPLARFDELHRHGGTAAFGLQGAFGAWTHQERVYANTRTEDATRTILLAPGLGDRQARALSTSAVGGTADLSRQLAVGAQTGVLRFGIDLSREHLDTSYRPVSDDGVAGAAGPLLSGRRLRTGVFVSSGWNPVPRVRVSGAVRWDQVSDDGFGTSAGATNHAWSPRIGVTVGLTDAVSLFSQVSTAFKVPTLNQLFDPRPYPDFSGGVFTISNRHLVPQRATNIEGGIHGGSAKLRWSALVYGMHVDDEIDFDARTFSYANIGESRHLGAEVEIDAHVWRVRPSAHYALTEVAGDNRDRQLKNVPRHNLALGATLDLPFGIGASVNYRWTAGAYLDDDNTIGIESPRTLDLRARRAIGRHVVFVDVVNLLNDRFVEYGFTLTDFRGATVPYAYPGAPRAARVGFTLGF